MCWPLAIPAIIAAGASVYGATQAGKGGQTVSSTQTQDWRSPGQKQTAEQMWFDWVDDFYGANREAINISDKLKSFSPAELEAFKKLPIVLRYRQLYPEVTAGWEAWEKDDILKHYYQQGISEGKIWPTDEKIEQIRSAPTPGRGKGIKERLGEDLAYGKITESDYLARLNELNTQYMGGIQKAASPYQQQLTDVLGQLQGGTGLGKPVSFGFGGRKMASFVPRQNRELVTQIMNIGKEGMQVDAGLVELRNTLDEAAAKRGFDFSIKHSPNEIANAYSQLLEELAFKMSTGQKTTAQTGTIPGQSSWQSVLAGLNTGANVARSLYPWGVQGNPAITVNTSPSSSYQYQTPADMYPGSGWPTVT